MGDPQRAAKRDLIERTGLTAAVALFFFLGYFAVGLSRVPAKAHEFSTSLDRRVPFIAPSIWIYLWSFSASLIPLFMIRCSRLFRRSSLAFAVVIGLSLICFTTVPVTALHLRADGAQLHAAGPSHWAVSAIYSLDPPYNLFPSLHISITALAAIAVWKANRRYGAALFVCLALVAVSVCTTKQHFLIDALGGLLLAALVGGLILGPYRRDASATYSWRGPASYLASVVLMYLGFYGAYLWGTHRRREVVSHLSSAPVPGRPVPATSLPPAIP
jgi:membrane-associated phospholipid phosphatase